jgi:hypothetical protein
VSRRLDAGDTVEAETFPLDSAAADDPMICRRYRREVLRPNGIRMLVDTVPASPPARVPCAQDHRLARTYPSPDYREVRELRSRVRRRRGSGS